MVELVYHRGFPWFEADDCFLKGYAFIPGKGRLEGKSLAAWFAESSDLEEFTARAGQANGMFSVIIHKDGTYWLAVDPARCFPVYYRMLDDLLHVSDSVENLLVELDWKYNSAAAEEFLAAGFVTGPETLAAEVFQVEAGQVLAVTGNQISRQFYWTYQAASLRPDSFEEELGVLDTVTAAMYRNLEDSLGGRTAVVALSGGYDSRFLLALLHKQGYEKLVCYSYGRKGNPELKVAGEVAKKLGVNFIPIVYEHATISGFEDQQAFRDYVDFSSNFSSMFFMQEYFAVQYLKDWKLVPDDAIFIPGHSADFLAGSQLIKHGLHAGREGFGAMVRRLYRTKYNLCASSPGRMKKRIRSTLGEKKLVEGALSFTVHEDWDLKEKLAKFLVNSCNVYAWFGYEYRLPFYDREFMEYFRDLSFELKKNKALYDHYLREGLFGDLGINMAREGQPSVKQQKAARVKGQIKEWIPGWLYRKQAPENDAIFYREITACLERDLREQGHTIRLQGGAYNSLLVQWYLEYLKLKYPGKDIST